MRVRVTLSVLLLVLAGGPRVSPSIGPAEAQEGSTKVRIGIIGAGNIGGTIGSLWVANGHEVMFSSRNPDGLKALVAGLGPKARAGTVEEASAFGDVVFLAVPYKAYPELSRSIGPALRGKVVLDAGNPSRNRDGALYDEALAVGTGIASARFFPGARLIRGFNAAEYKVFAKEGANGGGDRPGGRMAIPIAGDDPDALDVAGGLVRDAGFDPVVVGPLSDADRFALFSPGYGHDVTAQELRMKLGPTK